MKKSILLAVIAIAVLATASVRAADIGLPGRAALGASPFSWAGYYFGAQAGGGAFDPSEGAADPGVGVLLGGEIGYNWQFGMLVLGIEGEGF